MKKKIKKRIKLRPEAKNLIKKIALTIIILVVDLVMYHYLTILGTYVGQNSWTNAFILVGWFWLLAGQFGILYFMWG